jgi:M6 family metalloprotease-like protein
MIFRTWKLILVLSLAILMILFAGLSVDAAYLRNVPQTVTQPNGEILRCFASGDEFCNWLHDEKGFVIIKDPRTGYYVYVKNVDGTMVPTYYTAGKVDPQSAGLCNKMVVNSQRLRQQRSGVMAESESGRITAPTSGTINNLVIFIRFKDESEYSDSLQLYEDMFNTSATSMRNYFLEASYSQLTVDSTFYPITAGSTVLSYPSTHKRSYYEPYDSSTNPIGYGSDTQLRDREHALLRDAVNAASLQIPGTLNVDANSDGYVDNICFVVSGSVKGYNNLLWPHHWELSSLTVTINGARVWSYSFQLQNILKGLDFVTGGSGILCHEMFHSMGAPDLSHNISDGVNPAYKWDLMDFYSDPPQHMGAYMKKRYGNWIASIPEITESGTYSLNPITSSGNNCYKIASPNSSTEYFLVEYRKKTGTFESSVPGSGLLVYRIDTNCDGDGNIMGPPYEVYIFRPYGTLDDEGNSADAAFSSETGRTSINDTTTEPKLVLNDGGKGGFKISNIGSASGNTISFQVELKIPPPYFSIPGGTYNTSQVVSISCDTVGATIHYTTDGSEPTELSAIYTGPVTISATTTLKAGAFTANSTSITKSVIYTINTSLPESTHNYVKDLDYTWTYTLGGTHGSIDVTFDSLTKVESPFDKIYVMDADGNNITGSPFSGVSLAGQTVNITGSIVKIRLVSDFAYEYYGFRVTKIVDGSGPVDKPTFSPAEGTFTSSQGVMISCNMPEATIRYTMDGTDPNANSPTISSGSSIVIKKSLTLKAKAWKTSWASSEIQRASYTITVATPTISPDGGLFTTAQNVTVSCATQGATIRYTTDGTNPNPGSPIVASGSTIPVNATLTLKVKAWKTGCVTSPVKSSSFTITGTVSKPAFSPVAGTYGTAQSVMISCATVGATIRYTTDGSEPATDNGLIISSGGIVRIKTTTTLKAKAWKTDWATSGTKTALYTITSVAQPTFTPVGGAYGAPQAVTISCATPGAEIHYTTNGNDPAESDPVINSGDSISVDHPMTLKAKAWKTGLTASGVKSAVYTF